MKIRELLENDEYKSINGQLFNRKPKTAPVTKKRAKAIKEIENIAENNKTDK